MTLTPENIRLIQEIATIRISGDGHADRRFGQLIHAQLLALFVHPLTPSVIETYERNSFLLRAKYDSGKYPKVREALNALDQEFALRLQETAATTQVR